MPNIEHVSMNPTGVDSAHGERGIQGPNSDFLPVYPYISSRSEFKGVSILIPLAPQLVTMWLGKNIPSDRDRVWKPINRLVIMDPKKDTFYGYFVDTHVCIAYMVLFALTGVIHLGQSAYHRVWWLTPTFMFCAVAEVIGWGGRYWSSQDYLKLEAFLMQICCTIIAPSFLAAGLFFILGVIINRLGPQYATFSPEVFSTVFISCDLIALVIQAVGGASASISFKTGGDPNKGAKIMVGGIIFQIFAITVYVITALEFSIRYHFDRPVVCRNQVAVDTEKQPPRAPRPPVARKIQLMSFGLILSTVLLYIRSIYRTIELLDGLQGPIIQNQALFNYMDAFPIVLALFALNVLNPGRLLFGRNAQPASQQQLPPLQRQSEYPI